MAQSDSNSSIVVVSSIVRVRHWELRLLAG
jgi:hypothetical protein